MQTKDDLNASLLQAFPDSKVDLWDQNIVNGKYVIAYEMNPGLHPTLLKCYRRLVILAIYRK